MKAHHFIILYFFTLTMIIFGLGLLLPSLSFYQSADEMQQSVLRFLASFCFHGEYREFWQLTIVSAILFFIFCIIIFIKSKKEFQKFMKLTIFIHFLIIYFFWVIANNPSMKEDIRFDTGNNYETMSFYFILILLGVAGITKLINQTLIEKFIVEKVPVIPKILVSCPHCQAKYKSNPEYCVKCKKMMNSLE
jgi:hypothetical protein